MFSYMTTRLPSGVEIWQPRSTIIPPPKLSVNGAIAFRAETWPVAQAGAGNARPPPNTLNIESRATCSTIANRTSSPAARCSRPRSTRLRIWLRPSEKTIYTAILSTSDGIISTFVVMASLAGISNARLIMLAGLAELIAGALSMGAGGILAAKSNRERHQVRVHGTTRQIETDFESALESLRTSLAADLPAFIISDITTYCRTLPIQDQVALIMRFRQDPIPCPRDAYKAAITFFLTNLVGGLPALIPYVAVRKDQVYLAFYISIATTSVSSFAYGWAKTGYNAGWAGLGNMARCFWGAITFFGVAAVSAALSVVIIRGIDHNL